MMRRRPRIIFMYVLIDSFLIGVSFCVPFRINPASLPQYPYHDMSMNIYLMAYLFWGISLISFLYKDRLYYTDRHVSIAEEWLKVIKNVFFATTLVALFLFAIKANIFSRLIFSESAVLLILSLSAWRTLKRIYIRYFIRKGYANCNVLIVGAGETGVALAEEINVFPYLGIKTIGFLDDIKKGEIDGNRILGKIENIEKVINMHFVDEIYITIPSERRIVMDIIEQGEKLHKTVRVVPEFFGMPSCRVKLNNVGTMSLITYVEKRNNAMDSVRKWLMDVVFSATALILLLPFLLIIAYVIKIETPGPVFYVSKRSGKKGVAFDMYKFRSMVDNADIHQKALRCKSEVDGPIFKIRNDPRLTKVGGFLRRYSIDELPQLINVLKGDMSLVGARPFPVEESNNFEYRHIPRLNINPGMTGLAQIKGRSNLKFDNWVRWDMWYIENWSLWLDVNILLWTIPTVLKKKGAY